MIEETVAKIEAAIKEARGADPKNKAEEAVKDATLEFDATHPKLAAVIGEISSMLAKIGI